MQISRFSLPLLAFIVMFAAYLRVCLYSAFRYVTQVICFAGDQYALKMRLVDHVYDDQVIDQLTVKLILPEGARYYALVVQFRNVKPVHNNVLPGEGFRKTSIRTS